MYWGNFANNQTKPFLMDIPLWGGTIWMLCDYLTFGSNSYSRILSCTKSKCWTHFGWLCDVRNVDWSISVSDSKGCKEIRTKLWAFLCFYFLITISNTESVTQVPKIYSNFTVSLWFCYYYWIYISLPSFRSLKKTNEIVFAV